MAAEEEEAARRPGKIRDFEDVLRHVGGWNLYQALVFANFVLVCVMFAFLSYTPALFLYVPEHWCKTGEDGGRVAEPRLPGHRGDGLGLGARYGLPMAASEAVNPDGLLPKDAEGQRSSCQMYDLDALSEAQLAMEDKENWPTKGCTNGWVYNTTGLFTSAVTEMNWVCEDEYKGPLTQFVFYAGSIVGSLLFGYTGDKFGRLNTMFATSTLMLIGGLSLPFCPDLASFCVVRFVMGLTFPAGLTIFFMIALEVVAAEKRPIIGNLSLAIGFTLGGCTEPWILKWMEDWRMFHVTIFAPALILVTARWYLHESVMWLITAGRIDEAASAITRIACVNRKHLDEETINDFRNYALAEYLKSREGKWHAQGKNVTDLFKSPAIRRITLLTIFSWMFTFCLFLGHILNQSNIASSIYVSFTVSAALELPADLLTITALEYLGRRWTYSAGLALSGVAMLASGIVLENHIASTVFAMFGRFFITMAVNAGQHMMLEVFPTELRAEGTALTSSLAQVATLTAPYLAYSSTLFKPLPFLLMGGLGLLGGAFPLFLPETTDVPLPNTISEAEDLFKGWSFFAIPFVEKRRRMRRTAPSPISTIA